mmetsp:Transcript_12191/g.18193  ORF Transcript_12191/g.18193 Transcript_12191/m.18193 type:complete len:357 (+) Transcript_12191:30-1100(+)
MRLDFRLAFAATFALSLFLFKINAPERNLSSNLKARAPQSLRSCSRVRTFAKAPREVAPMAVLRGIVGSVVVSTMLTNPAFSAIVKGAPILATEAPAAVEIQVDEAHGQSEIMEQIGTWDKDKNGRITRDEFEAGMRDYVPHELSPGQLDQAWARIQGVELERRATDPSYAGNKLTEEQKQLPQPGQPINLPTDRVESSIPRENGGVWKYPSPQQAYNAMVRKGKDPDIFRAKDFVSTHNEMNERGWSQVLKYESVTHPECPKNGIKLAKFNGDYEGRVPGSFDRHYWTVNRCGKEEQKYILDYFDTKKFDEITMPYSNDDIEIRVKPDNDAKGMVDTLKHKMKTGNVYSSTSDPK